MLNPNECPLPLKWLLAVPFLVGCVSHPAVDATDEYASLAYAPCIEVLDTTSSLGPLAGAPRVVDLRDLVAWHGHPCDGLVAATVGLAHGLSLLFPSEPVDRTDLCAATNRSACYGDVAAFLTGARHRYGSLTIDPELGDEWWVHRRSTGQSVRIRLRPGIKPTELPRLEAELRGAGCPPGLMRRVAALQDRFARALLQRDPGEQFDVELVHDYPYPTGELRPDTRKRDCLPQAATSAP